MKTTIACAIFLFVVAIAGCRRDYQGPLPSPAADGAIEGHAPILQRADHGGSLFNLLSPEQTQVDFIIRWDKSAEYDRIFYSQNTGGGVCVGDYDGDERPDIYLTRPSGGNRLYRNIGDFRFEDVTDESGLRDDSFWGTGASFVDIDNDGDLDLYVCGYDCPNRLYMNRGNGTFRERAAAVGLDFHGASVMMSFADYDRDGDLDGYLVTAGLPPDKPFRVRFEGDKPVVLDELREYWALIYLPGDRAKQVEAGQYDHLFRNDGTPGKPRFVDVTQDTGIASPDIGQAATWWDYDRDGWPDLYVANDYWGADKLYHNNAGRSFTDVAATALPHTPWSSMGTDVADINGDGLLDLIATDMAGTNHFKQKVGMGDMDKRGWFLEYGHPRQYMRNAVYLNTGTDRFMEVAHLTGLSATDWTWTPRFDDFDNDGQIDLFVTNGTSRDFTHSDINAKAVSQTTEGTPEFFGFWMKQEPRRDRNLAYRNLGNLRFEQVSTEWGLDRLGVSYGAATGDLDGDGDLDLVVNNMDAPTSIYRNNSSSGNFVRVRLQGTKSNRAGLGSLVTLIVDGQEQVRYLTHARGWTSQSEPTIHFGVGPHETMDSLFIQWPSGTEQSFADLATNQFYVVTEPTEAKPSERRPEIAEPLFTRAETFPADKIRHREQAFDDFQRQPLLPNKLSQLGPGMAWADVNGDGRNDFYLSGARGQAGQLFVATEGGGFETSVQRDFAAARECEQMGAVFFDADEDGDADLYVVSGGVECAPNDKSLQDQLYFNDGRGQFARVSTETLPSLRDSGSVVAAADFDRDGDLDLFVGGRVRPGEYPLASASRLLQNNGGSFTEVTDLLAADLLTTGMVTSAVWSDANDDGWVDLIVAHEWGPVKLFANNEGRFFDGTTSNGLASYLGWWNGIAASDIDHDGDIDYVATNFGLNVKYHASHEHPTQIHYGDFDNSGKMRIVESKYEGDTLLPVRGKSCSTGAMPFLADRFPTFTSFAAADLGEIYSTERLDKSHHFSATTLESGVFVNNGQGRFEFRQLPRLAQASPAFGVAITDVNADGHDDIYLVQNFYSPQRETGRMDGGVSQLLLGVGDGSFKTVWPCKSGLIVPGDAKSLVCTDLNYDGRPDFVVGVNDDTVRAFQNNCSTGEPFVVRLHGAAGNRQAIGARVMVERGDGLGMTREVHAGGGYLSQSSASLAFGLGTSAGEAENTIVREITVRWPDGTISTSHPEEQSQVITIAK